MRENSVFTERLWRITAPHFCAGLTESYDGFVVQAAPIIHYMINRPMAWVRRCCQTHEWKLEQIDA